MKSHQLPEGGENDILSLVIWNRRQILNRVISHRLFLLCFIFSHKTIHGIYFEKLLIVNRFLKGVINIRPALPRYVTVWNLSKICQYIKIQPALARSDLKTVSHRPEILLCLTTAQWYQTIKCFHLNSSKVVNVKEILLNPE